MGTSFFRAIMPALTCFGIAALPIAGLSAPTVVEYAIPTANSGATQIVAQAKGFVWFTETAANRLGRISSTGVVAEFSVPTRSSDPVGITEGPDGNIWFTEYSGNNVGRVDEKGNIREFLITTSGAKPLAIAPGKLRKAGLWFIESGGHYADFVSISGSMTRLPLVSVCPSGLLSVASASHGPAWFSGENPYVIWSIDNSGKAFEVRRQPNRNYPVCSYTRSAESAAPVSTEPSNFLKLWPKGAPENLALDVDGSAWLADRTWNGPPLPTILHVRLHGSPIAYAVPSGHAPTQFATAARGGAWFTEFTGDRIGRVDSKGRVTEYKLAPGSGPTGIVEAQDGSIWLVEQGTNKIALIKWSG